MRLAFDMKSIYTLLFFLVDRMNHGKLMGP